MSGSSSGFSFHPRSKFDAFLEGELSASADSKVRAHLAVCSRCAEEVEQRSSALSVTQQLDRISREHPVPASYATTTPVMEPSGVAGWKFLVGASVVGLVVVGIVVSLWVLGGDQRTQESAGTSAQELIPEDVEIVGADPQDLSQPPPSDDSTEIPTDFGAASAQLSYNSAPLGIDGTPIHLNSVSELRQAGWTIPQFHALGMAFESAVVDEQQGQVYVMSVFNASSANADDQTVVRECRVEHDDGSVTACSRLDFTDSAANEVSLPVAEDVWLYTYPDGSWTAYMATNKSQYRVDSTSEADYADGIMSTLYVEEKSRLSSGSSNMP
ncbi:hypothetical protein GCM10009720_02520 [Yaniella flava]|uniref:Putative zinc-finger domain-containing protein n=1 Tax=Yaniella flava TaxID=287930 RepID=A0ABN2U1H5_9MICC|nr:zf-HC2 domain-containing protein [Micrococcaceae bacterium]